MISARKSYPVRDYTTVSATLAWRWLLQQHSNNGYEGDIEDNISNYPQDECSEISRTEFPTKKQGFHTLVLTRVFCVNLRSERAEANTLTTMTNKHRADKLKLRDFSADCDELVRILAAPSPKITLRPISVAASTTRREHSRACAIV